MFDIFIKKSQIVLDCFTPIGTVYDTAKINHGIHFVPEWWKETPKINEGWTTIKNCRAFKEFYKFGIVIPSWFDMEIHFFGKDAEEGKEISIRYSNDNVDLSKFHSNLQFEKFSLGNGQNLKISSPWGFRTKEEIRFVWSQPTWNVRKNISLMNILPGVIDFRYQHHVAINYLLMKPEIPQTINIEPLSPLVILHPLTEKKVEIKNHLVSENEYKRLFAIEDLILTRDAKDEIKEYDKKKKLYNQIENLSSCPFTGKS
jgi:hypothetical protein